MSKISCIKPTDRQAIEWVKEAGSQKRRLVFTDHAELRMKERRIGRRQVLQTLQNGHISEPLHQDVRGDWRCNVSWFYAGVRLTVGVVFKLSDKGEWVVIATVFEG
jgi:hypothetical protein